ncbi:MAG: chromate efflux transporter [Hyphomonas sp.]|jgi:chromate transporter|tara:strand:- start:41705 stop:43069 length:1365 start_codon:yes stop_codon:yes gene_type:complete
MTTHGVSFAEATKVWIRIAALSFGGPAGQIAVMHRILVEEKKWIGEERFLHALNYCMLLPGPEAQQLATYIGWLMHRTAGGLVAGGLFILPGFLTIMVLSWVYAAFGNVGVVEGLFFGLRAAVLAIVVQAVFRIGKRALKNRAMLGIAISSFIAIFAFGAPFPAIIAAAALVGFIGARTNSPYFRGNGGHAPTSATIVLDRESRLGEGVPKHARPSLTWSLGMSVALLGLWLTPVAALVILLGPENVFSEIAVFFSKMAVVTFGGAYAVLGYVAQEGVTTHGWLAPGEMLDGLSMAETTPGPLIQVVQFVGFMGAYRDAGPLPPMLAGTLAAILATWVTFVPCFLWIFLGAPFAEGLRANRALSGALAAITAAVVGVVLNLSVWFAIHTLFRETTRWSGFGLRLDVPVLASADVPAILLSTAAMIAVLRFKAQVMVTLGACATIGVILRLAATL